MEDGFYAVKNGKVYKINPRIKMPVAKSVNIKTGVVHYPTNADRIRDMSSEELAAYLDNMQWVAYINGFDNEPIHQYPNNYGAWLDWLKQEATDGKQD